MLRRHRVVKSIQWHVVAFLNHNFRPLSSTNVSSRPDEAPVTQAQLIDLEALNQTVHDPSISLEKPPQDSAVLQKLLQTLLSYPAPNSLKLRPTSWLDGVRGVAALAVYLFHTMGCWAGLVPAWHSYPEQNHFLQMPLLRSIFVSGPAAVSVFFVLSGYVLTHKCLGLIRENSAQQVYRSVFSSMFRRGFRLYLPPIFLTFCAMLLSRVGITPALSFDFVPEPSLWRQFLDWLMHMNEFLNPVYNWKSAMQGFTASYKYDPVIWTIPLEFYGSFMCYFLLLGLAPLSCASNGMRMGLVAALAVVFMGLGSWNLFCFAAGMVVADFNLGQEEERSKYITVPSSNPPQTQETASSIVIPSSNDGSLWPWAAIFTIAFYLAGFPPQTNNNAGSERGSTPGYETLLFLTPQTLYMKDPARFWWSVSGVSFLLSISQLPSFRRIFETNLCQYLGKISFSLYLFHELCLQLFGLWIQGLLMRLASLEPRSDTLGYWLVCIVWYVLFTLPVFALAAQVERLVDRPSVEFARWLEGWCMKVYRSRSV